MNKIIKINKNKMLINGKGGPLLLNSEIKKGKGISPIILEEEKQLMVGKGVVLKNGNNNMRRKPLKLNI